MASGSVVCSALTLLASPSSAGPAQCRVPWCRACAGRVARNGTLAVRRICEAIILGVARFLLAKCIHLLLSPISSASLSDCAPCSSSPGCRRSFVRSRFGKKARRRVWRSLGLKFRSQWRSVRAAKTRGFCSVCEDAATRRPCASVPRALEGRVIAEVVMGKYTGDEREQHLIETTRTNTLITHHDHDHVCRRRQHISAGL